MLWENIKERKRPRTEKRAVCSGNIQFFLWNCGSWANQWKSEAGVLVKHGRAQSLLATWRMCYRAWGTDRGWRQRETGERFLHSGRSRCRRKKAQMPLWSDEADFSFINNWSFYPTTQWQVKRGPSLEELPRMATERHTHEKQHLPEDAVSEELRMLRRGKTRTFSFFSLQISPHWPTKRYFSKTFFFLHVDWLTCVAACVCVNVHTWVQPHGL